MSAEREGRRRSVPAEEPSGFPRWKKVLLAAAGAFVVLGLVLQVVGAAGEEGARVADGRSGVADRDGDGVAPGATSLVPGGPQTSGGSDSPGGGGGGPSRDADPAAGAGDWSPFFLEGGLGFFAGFCVGFALRAFFKVSAIAVGVILLALLGLEQAGVVQIDYGALSDLYDSAAARVGEELGSVKETLNGILPSAAFAGLGLFTGFKGRR